MSLEVIEDQGVTVIRLRKTLDMATSPALEAKFKELIASGVTRVVVNLAAVDFVTSAGLRILITASKKLNELGGALRICGLKDQVRLVFEISGITTLLHTHAEEQSAVADF